MKSFPHADWSNADDMSEYSAERWNAASGYLVILLGIAGAAFERGSPPFTAPIEEVVAFWSKYQRELLAESVMFIQRKQLLGIVGRAESAPATSFQRGPLGKTGAA